MLIVEPDLIDIMDDKPRDPQSGQYAFWTIQLERKAKREIEDRNLSRNVLACAEYLNVSCVDVESEDKVFDPQRKRHTS